MRTAFIILIYNSEKWLPRCLHSLKETTPRNSIYICLDNASQDNGIEIFKQFFPQGYAVKNNINHGFSKAANMAAEKAISMNADVLAFINPDTWFEEGWFEPIMELLKKPEAGACAPYQLEYYTNEPSRWAREIVGDIPDNYREVEWLEGSCLLIRSELFLRAGKFYEGFFMYFEDEHLSRVLRHMGFKCLVSGKSFYHHHGSSAKLYPHLIRSMFVLNLITPDSSFFKNTFTALRTLMVHIKDAVITGRLPRIWHAFSGFSLALIHLPRHLKKWREDKKRIEGLKFIDV